MNTSYLTPAGFTLTDSWLDYSGPGTATLSQPLLALGSAAGFGCQQAGATLIVPMNAGNISLSANLYVG